MRYYTRDAKAKFDYQITSTTTQYKCTIFLNDTKQTSKKRPKLANLITPTKKYQQKNDSNPF